MLLGKSSKLQFIEQSNKRAGKLTHVFLHLQMFKATCPLSCLGVPQCSGLGEAWLYAAGEIMLLSPVASRFGP